MKVCCPACHQHYLIENPSADGCYQCLYCGEKFRAADAVPLEAENTTPAETPVTAPVMPPRRPVPTAAPSSRALGFAAFALAVLALLAAMLAGVRTLRQDSSADAAVAALRTELAALQTESARLSAELAATRAGLAATPPDGAAAPAEVAAMRQQLDEMKQTQDAVRAWQSKYTATLDEVVKLKESQSLEQAFTRINLALNQLYAPQGDLAKVYLAINQLSNAMTENLIILNTDVKAQVEYSAKLADAIQEFGVERKALNRDLENLFRRVNWLERHENNNPIVFIGRPCPPPPPRPPQPRGINLSVGK